MAPAAGKYSGMGRLTCLTIVIGKIGKLGRLDLKIDHN
jgi:hypothetical protein